MASVYLDTGTDTRNPRPRGHIRTSRVIEESLPEDSASVQSRCSSAAQDRLNDQDYDVNDDAHVGRHLREWGICLEEDIETFGSSQECSFRGGGDGGKRKGET